jgi:NAD(P)-dependent dehydrogenase (short-subunit alcohol dehydrogenase family)
MSCELSSHPPPQTFFSLAGKVAVVTGASRGIGSRLAAALATAGAAVALLGRDMQALTALQETLAAQGFKALALPADVADTGSLDARFQQVQDCLGGLDILINNAGVEEVCPSLDVSESLWDRIVGTNLKGAFFCAQAAARRMPSGGSIVNICSLTSEVGVAGSAAYGASKSGLVGLTHALATEWGPSGVRVNGIGPGYFRTSLTESFYANDDWQRSMLEKIPLRRFGQLADLGGAVIFLCSQAAAYITGQVLYIDGGYLAAL